MIQNDGLVVCLRAPHSNVLHDCIAKHPVYSHRLRHHRCICLFQGFTSACVIYLGRVTKTNDHNIFPREKECEGLLVEHLRWRKK